MDYDKHYLIMYRICSFTNPFYSISLSIAVSSHFLFDELFPLTNRGIVFNGKTAKELYLERHELYSKYCHYEIKTNNLSEEELITIIKDNIF